MSYGKVNITDITDRITLHRYIETPFNEGNIVCVEMNDGLIFIDAGRNVNHAKKFRKQMEEKYQKATKFLILTHTHTDHIYGMGAFNDVPAIMAIQGKEEIAQLHAEHFDTREGRKAYLDELTKTLQETNYPNMDAWLNYNVPTQLDADWFDPQILIKDSMEITDGEHEIVLKVVGGHSPCSLVIFDKTSNILFTGDNLNSEHADNSGCMLARAYLGIDLMEKWLDKDITLFVPGHGKPVDIGYLEIALAYFKSMKKSLTNLKEKQTPEEYIFNHPSIPAFYEDKTPKYINRILSRWYGQIKI